MMPSKSNFYSVIKGKTTGEANLFFQKNDWAIRKSSFSEYEYRNTWAELVLENDGEDLLLHGLIDYNSDNAKIIQELFENLNCPYKFEFYNENNLMIQEVKKGI